MVNPFEKRHCCFEKAERDGGSVPVSTNSWRDGFLPIGDFYSICCEGVSI